MIVVRDTHGRPLFCLDSTTAETGRDTSGKPVAKRIDLNDSPRLAALTAGWSTGRKVLMDLSPGDVATASTELELGITDGEYIADRVSRVVMVKHDRGVWYPENASDAITPPLPSASSDGAPAFISPGWTPASFVTTTYALATRIPRLIGSNADFDLKRRALRRIVQAIRLAREIRVAKLLTTSANWASGNLVTLAAAFKWNGGATANPLADMMSALQKSYLAANAMILPENVAQSFYVQPQASTGIRDYVQAGGEMPERLYARAKQFVAGAVGYVWATTLSPSNVAIVRVTDEPDTIPTSVTLRWIGQGPDGEVVNGFLVRAYRDAEADSDVLVVTHSDSEAIVSNQVGALIVGATQ